DVADCLAHLFFFFSSRRRHTRSKRDWSSDVCSSDLVLWAITETPYGTWRREFIFDPLLFFRQKVHWRNYEAGYDVAELEPASRRSEERRVGKECSSREAQERCQKN